MKRPLLITVASLLLLTGAAVLTRAWMRHRPAAPATMVPAPAAKQQIPERPSRVPDLIAKLCDPSLHRSRHAEAISSLPDDLTQAEFDELLDFIRGPVPQRLKVGSWHVTVNEIMRVLRQPRFKVSGYADAMAGMVLDRSADPVVRDYAAQHLAVSLDRVAHDPTPADFRHALETFLKVVTSPEEASQGVTGTILMSLTAQSATFHPEDLAPYRERLEAGIVALASADRPVSLSNRISAIQAAGRLGVTQALPAIRQLARDSATSPALRMSSVAALGYFHQPEDRGFLQEIVQNPGSSLSKAAQTALTKYPTP